MHFLFHFSALSVLPFWAAMILFPRAKRTATLVASPWIGLPAALCYLALAAPHALELVRVFGSPSPEALASVMGAPWAASMFWAYAGSFDLFVGRWIHLDASERGITHAFVAPIQIICVFFGPLAFTLYALVRWAHARQHPSQGAVQRSASFVIVAPSRFVSTTPIELRMLRKSHWL